MTSKPHSAQSARSALAHPLKLGHAKDDAAHGLVAKLLKERVQWQPRSPCRYATGCQAHEAERHFPHARHVVPGPHKLHGCWDCLCQPPLASPVPRSSQKLLNIGLGQDGQVVTAVLDGKVALVGLEERAVDQSCRKGFCQGSPRAPGLGMWALPLLYLFLLG